MFLTLGISIIFDLISYCDVIIESQLQTRSDSEQLH